MAHSQSQIDIGVIGAGFIGAAHLGAFDKLRQDGFPVRIVAVCDRRFATPMDATTPNADGNLEAVLGGASLDWSTTERCIEAAELLAIPDISIVCICTPTDTHVEIALAALAAGKHVIIEKPVALRSADVRQLRDAAAQYPRQLVMPALCMRFWPGWDWLREQIVARTLGAVRSAVFQRLGSRPAWSDFYNDESRSGGALVDLHVHDADFVRWLFGDPASVVSTGSSDHVTTLYRFDAGPPHVVAEGGWDHAGGWPFRMRYVVAFEHATAEFDSGREPALRLSSNGRTDAVPIEAGNGWEREIRDFVEIVASNGSASRLRASLADAEAVARLLECEAESLRSGAPVRFPTRS